MRELIIGGFYRHFKDKLYQVKGIAYHSETKEKMVVYQALYGDYSLYVRPYEMFLSEVDRKKYPEVQQKYRFEQVFPGEDISHKPVENENTCEDKKISDNYNADENEAEQIDKRLEAFLDAPDIKEKLNVLASIKHNMDDKLIDSIAVCMDIEVPQGRIEERIASLRSCLLMKQKYECSRLR